MKPLALSVSVMGFCTLWLLPPSAFADTNEQVQAANATRTAVARANADLANAIAQGRITLTPTPLAPTPAPPTFTPRPTATPEPDPPTESSTPLPVLLAPPADSDPVAAYIRPSTTEQAWFELALPQGRWDFRFDTASCEPLGAWSNVWLAPDVDPPLLVARGGPQDDAMCGVAQSAWHSDMPCAMTDGQCDLEADAAFWADLAVRAPPLGADLEVTTGPAAPAPTAIARVVVPARVAQPMPPALIRQVEIVVQTVVVVITAVPSDTPTPRAPQPPAPLLVNATPRPTPTPIASAVATTGAAMNAPAPLRQVAPAPQSTLEVARIQSATNPVAEHTPAPPAEAPGPAAWLFVVLAVCGAIAVAGVRRRLAADRIDRHVPVGSVAARLHAVDSHGVLAGEYFQRRLAVVAALGIILSAILILTPVLIEHMMDR